MSTVGTTVGDLVLGHVPGVHDGVAAIVPSTSGVGLAPAVITAAGSGTAGVLKTTAVLNVS